MKNARKYLIMVLMLMVFPIQVFSETQWINIAATVDDGNKWDFQPGSLEFSHNQKGAAIATVTGRIVNSQTTQIAVHKWYVTVEDCTRKLGTVVTLSISGQYQFENEFVFGSGSIASALAETICNAADYRLKETHEKSL